MQIAQILAGYSLGEADLLRRAMGKKKKEEMDQQQARFVSGAAERGHSPPPRPSGIFDLVAKFAGYGFNKSHAAAYALISYQTAWLKTNAPVEFFAASMSLDISNTDKLAVFYQDARAPRGDDPPARRQPLGRRLRGRGRRGALRPGRRPQRRPGGHGAPGGRARGGRAASATCSTSSSGSIRARSTSGRWRTWPAPAPSTASTPTAPRSSPPPTTWSPTRQSVAAERASAQASLFGGDRPTPPRPRLPKRDAWSAGRTARRGAGGGRLLPHRPSAGGHDRGAAPPAHHPAGRRPGPGRGRHARPSAWPASSAAARSGPRPAAARSSPSSPCPTPPANMRCCSRRSRCAAAARRWSRARR